MLVPSELELITLLTDGRRKARTARKRVTDVFCSVFYCQFQFRSVTVNVSCRTASRQKNVIQTKIEKIRGKFKFFFRKQVYRKKSFLIQIYLVSISMFWHSPAVH